jgi:protein phosphatase
VGRIRPLNEDYHRVWQFPLADGELTLLAVADGMGGAAAGEVASKLAMEVLDESFSRYVEEMRAGNPVVGIDKLTVKAMRLANRRVYAAAIKNQGRRGMGTTLTCVAVLGRRAHVGHVGDSRAYMVRGNKIYQLTKDHSWVEEQLEKGLLSEDEAEQHEWRNLITRALGTRPQVAPDVIEIGVEPGDVFVISTDGLHGLVKPEEILGEVKRTANRQLSVEYLISLANERGGPDNITLVIAEVA